MKRALFCLPLVAFLLAGCGAAIGRTPTPLPTVVLDSGLATPAPSAPAGGGVTASGFVVPEQEAQLAFSLGERVAEIRVAVGDAVKAGQALMTLAGGENLSAAVEAASLALVSAQQALDQLDQNADLARAQAQLDLAEAEKALDKATKKRTSQDYHVGSQDAIDLAWADYVRAQKAVEDVERTWEYFKNRDPQDVNRAEVLAQLARTRQTRDTALANYNYLRSKPNQLDVNEADAQLQVARASLAAAQLALEKVKDGPDPDQLALATSRVSSAQAQLEAAQANLRSLSLTAPFAGTVSRINVHAGEWVTPGQPVLLLADLAHLQVQTTDLSERDVPQVALGQAVTVLIKALGQEVSGRVTEIAPLADTLGGDVVYQTTIALDSQPDGLRAGMSVDVQFAARP